MSAKLRPERSFSVGLLVFSEGQLELRGSVLEVASRVSITFRSSVSTVKVDRSCVWILWFLSLFVVSRR